MFVIGLIYYIEYGLNNHTTKSRQKTFDHFDLVPVRGIIMAVARMLIGGRGYIFIYSCFAPHAHFFSN